MAIEMIINGKPVVAENDPEMPLLWFLRDILGLMGTKYSCGVGVCGTCTVIIDGVAKRSCTSSIGSLNGAEIITIEGIGEDNLHRVQEVFAKHNVVHCGYCTPGQIMTAAALFNEVPNPSKMDIENEMHNVLCRCGSYQRIRAALFELAGVE